ncbi:MAG: polysaccharide deacetylase family protein [Lentisphaerae bacterium]|nr:polysaccharide deacetylase family protein [Lentisphaerota bacterium]
MKHAGRYTVVGAGVLLAALALAMGLTARLREARQVRAAPVLMYHKIGAVTDNAWWVPTDVFERQLRALRNQGYATILPADLINHHRTGKRLPPKPIIITFDDGYRDSLALAEPLLKKYGFRAVVFLPTTFIAETPETRQSFEGQPGLTWPEVKAMQERRTFVFGGHSHRHENLIVAADAEADIRECFDQLRRHAIRPPFAFCYPHGQYNEQTVAAVKRTGFQIAFIGEDRVARTGRTIDLLTMPRVSVMGGRHSFRFSSSHIVTDKTGNNIGLCVRHEGIPIEVSPRLVVSGAAADQCWLPAVEVSNADYEWRWPPLLFPLEGVRMPLRLEIWDKHRLFLLWSVRPGFGLDVRTR